MLFPDMKSVLITPATKTELYYKTKSSNADLVLIDFEDSIPLELKEIAREKFIENHTLLDDKHGFNFRINSLRTVIGVEDLLFLIKNRININWLLLTKVDHGHIIEIVKHIFKSNNLHSPKIMSLIESGEGIVNIDSIARESDAVMFGAADYALDFSLPIDSMHNDYARATVAIWANRFKIPAIDSPTFYNIRDENMLQEECIKSRNMGFSGKLAISKSQVNTINTTYTYSRKEIAWANDVLKVKQDHSAIKVVADNMVGPPFYNIAKLILNIQNTLEGN